MPFTTMNNYNWLFDVDSLENYIPLSIDTSLPQNQHTPAFSPRLQEKSNNDRLEKPSTIEMSASNESSHVVYDERFNSSSRADSMDMDSSIQFPPSNASIPITSESISSLPLNPAGTSSPEQLSRQIYPSSTSKTSVHKIQPRINPQQLATRLPPITAADPLETFSQTSRTKKLPVVDELTRHHVLDLVVQASPTTPEGCLVTREHPLLSLSALQNYCDLFFCRFNVTYPLLHQATFEPSQVEPLLLISVLLLGATYGEKAGHRLAVCIHDVLRAQIFQNAAFKAQPDLWILQTILLVECFGKSRAGQTQHDMSHLFHGLLIK
jgi:hypothetical protein